MTVPTRLGPYDLVAELGRGAMGVVYRAVDRRLQREVALKVLLGAADAAGLEDFTREARAAARLRHPGIVVVYGADVIDGLRVVALELVQGGSLQQRLRDGGPLPSRDAARIVADLAAAVEAAHAEGVVHRDLKPANVLLERDGRPRLTDFGLARDERAGARSNAGDIIGTPAYMAPEQALGEVHRVGPRTDVWGLGAVLFECLTGQPPFRGRTAQDVMRNIVEVPAPSPSEVRRRRGLEPLPADLSTICLMALAKAPERRYASAGALEEDLRRWLDGRPIFARPPSALGELLRAWRRHRLVVGVALGAAVVTAVLAWLVPDLLSRGARERAHAAVLEAVGTGEGRLVREKAVFELTKDKDPAAVPVLIAALDHLTARMHEVTRAHLLGVLEPRDEEERARQAKLEGLAEALDAARRAAPDARLEPAHVRVIDEARRRLSLRAAKPHRRADVLLGDLHRVELGPDTVLRASVAAEALGRLSDPAAAEALGRYLHVEEHHERTVVAAQALGRLRDLRAARMVLRMGGRHARSGACHNLAFTAFARELGGKLPAFEPVTALDHLDRGRLRALLDDLEGAMADFDRALALDPDDPAAWAARASLHMDDQAWILAVADYDRVVALEPDEPAALVGRSIALSNQPGKEERGLPDAERALALDPHDPDALLARAKAIRKRDRARALADLARALELDEGFSGPWSTRAALRRELGDHQGAIDDAGKALALDPEQSAVWNNRAISRMALGRLDEAIQDFDRAHELDPKDFMILANRGYSRMQRGDRTGALEDLAAALELKPTCGIALAVRGQLRRREGDLEGARADLRAALEAAPEDAQVWGLWAGFAAATGDLREARRAYERQLELSPDDAIALQLLSGVLGQLGEVQRSYDLAKRASDLQPREPQVWLTLARALHKKGELLNAVVAAEQAVNLEPENPGHWRERGSLRLFAGDLEGALADGARAIELDDRDHQSFNYRGHVHRIMGNAAAAIRDFERVLELLPPDDAAGRAEARENIERARRGG